MSIPTNLRVPFIAAEFDDSLAEQGSSILTYKALLIGQKTSAGTKAAGSFYKLTPEVPNQYFGVGSDLAIMANKWFENNKYTEVYGFPYDDPTGAAATGKITVTGPATADGEIALMINGVRIPVTVASADTATIICAAMVAAINAKTELPLTAAVNGVNDYECDLTFKHDGIIGNSIDVQWNYYDGEYLPAGTTLTLTTAMSSGTGSVDFTTVIAAMGEDWYQIIVGSAVDATALGLIEAELLSRFGPLRMIDGMYFCARRGVGADKATKLGELITFGDGRNSKHVTCMNNTYIPNSPQEMAAAYAAQAAYEGAIDPNRPLQTLQLVGILPPKKGERNSISDDNSLLMDGIATFSVVSTSVTIQRAITMYQENGVGADSTSYMDVVVLLTLMYMRYDFRSTIQRKYPRAKLANDGTRIKSGIVFITPKIGKAEALSIFRGWEEMGLAENVDQFKRDLVCVRSSTDPNRLEWILQPDLVNQFRIGAALIRFLLQGSTTTV